MRNGPMVVCEHCKREFALKHGSNAQRFCSRACTADGGGYANSLPAEHRIAPARQILTDDQINSLYRERRYDGRGGLPT